MNGTGAADQPPFRLAEGAVLGGFRLVRRIGAGGMGTVWEADETALKRRVALKVLAPQLSAEPLRVQRFHREAEAGGRLHHPGIVQVYAVGESQGLHYIVQELVPGGLSLADSLEAMRKQPELPAGYYQQVARFFVQVAEALEAAHAAGVVHRDVKPGNILLTESEEPKVSDFGLAMVQDELALSRTGELGGTPFYMSPEQAASQRMGLDHRSDVFSLGASFYEALTLTRPFGGDTIQEVLGKILLHDPVEPARLRSRLPRDISVICMTALEKKRERRYQSMTAFAADLKRFLHNETILARPPGPIVKTGKWVRRHPAVAAAGAVAAVGFAAVSLLLLRTLEAEATARGALASEQAALKTAVDDRKQARWESYKANVGAAEVAVRMSNAAEAERRLEAAPGEYRGWEWFHLSGRVDRSIAAWNCHPSQVRSIAFQPGGPLAATCSWDGSVRIWEADTGRLVHDLHGGNAHRDLVLSVAFSPDGARLASASYDRTVKIWDPETGTLLRTLEGHRAQVASVAWSPDGRWLASGSYDATARLWRASDFEPAGVLQGHGSVVYAVTFTPSSAQLVTGSWDGTARVWDLEQGETLRVLRGHTAPVWAVAVGPSGRMLATGGADNLVMVWDVRDGRRLATLRGHAGKVVALDFHPAGGLLASASWDDTVRLWTLPAASGGAVAAAANGGSAAEAAPEPFVERVALQGHRGWVWDVTFARGGSTLASAGYDGTVRFWDAAQQGGTIPVLRGHRGWVYSVAFLPGGTLASGAMDGTVRLWDPQAARPIRVLEGHTARVAAVAAAPDGRFLASLGMDDTIRLWEGPDWRPATVIRGHGHQADITHPLMLAFSPDGRQLAAGGGGNTLKIWSVPDGALLQALTGHAAPVHAVAFSPDGSLLASGSLDGEVRLWNLPAGTPGPVLAGHRGPVVGLAFHPDPADPRLVSASYDGTARIWDARKGRLLSELLGHSGWVSCVAFSPDGSRLATGSVDTTIKIWDPGRAEEIVTLFDHRGALISLAWEPGGRYLASGATDFTVRVWGSPGR